MNEFINSPSNYQVKQLSLDKPSNKTAEVIVTSFILLLGMPSIKQTEHSFNTMRYSSSKETDFFDKLQNLEYDIYEIKKQQNETFDSYKVEGVSYDMSEQNNLTQRDFDILKSLMDEKEQKIEATIQAEQSNTKSLIASAKEDILKEIGNNKRFTITTWVSIVTSLIALASLLVAIFK